MKKNNYARSIILAISITLVAVFTVFSQTAPGVSQEMRTEANRFFQAADWAKSVSAYGKIVEIEPTNPNANYRLGFALMSLNRNVEAQPHLEKAFATSPNPLNGLAMAKVYGRLGNKAKTIETLEKCIAFGGIAPEVLTADADFAAWKDDAGFKEAVRKNDFAVNPCKASPEFRQFDFWIGDWDVKSTQGQAAGSSSIQLILGQCILLENWTGNASSGKSFNIFDAKDKKWHQTWVDDRGTFTHYVGGFEDGKMVLVADTVIGGKKTMARMTFSKMPNGDVRQLGENSTDDGKTWGPAPSFDLIYSRKK